MAPAWWEGHELHAWFEIPDTAGAGGTAIDASTAWPCVNSRFRYVSALCGFALLPTRDANLWFIRTA